MQYRESALVRSEETSALAALRAATSALHIATERHPLVRSVLSPSACVGDLVGLYCAFREFHALIEPYLQAASLPASLLRLGYRYRPRLPLLEADLSDLAGPLWPRQCVNIAAPHWKSPLGLLYVVEGASQGGRVIGPRLTASLGVGPDWGARYFHVRDATQWVILRDWLALEDGGDPDKLVDAGREAFILLQRAFDQVQSVKSTELRGG